jgi:hypothetical protein
MATSKTVTKTTASWSIANQESMGKELGLSLTNALDASMSFNDWVAKIHKASKGIVGTVRSKDPFMLAVQGVLKAHRYNIITKAGVKKNVGYPPNTIKTYLSNVRKAIRTGNKIDNGNSGKVSTILIALGQKAELATMVDSLRKGFNKMKDNESNPAMQRLAAFLIDALDDVEA